MSLRWEFERDGVFNVPFKVEIYDSQYVGSSIVLDKIGAKPAEVQMGTPGADPLEKIKGSFLTIRLFGVSGDYDDLFDRNNERWLVKLYIDGNHESDFIPIPDTFTDYVTDGQYTNEIKCANLSLFKQKQIDDMLGEWPLPFGPVFTSVSRLEVIEDIIGQLFDMDVIDGVVFKPGHIAAGNPSLRNQFINPRKRLAGMNCYEALEELIPKGHQMRVSKGKIFILPITEASFVGYDVATPTLYDDNFVSTNIGGRLSKSRTRLQTYDGVKRFYDPLEAENIVPSGELELVDFGLDEDDINNNEGEVDAIPVFWSAQRGNYARGDTKAKLISGGVAWLIPESVGNFVDQPAIEANNPGFQSWEAWKADSGVVLEGTRLKIDLSFNYVSRNNFAHLPIKIKVGDNVLFRGRDATGRLVAGDIVWRQESNGLLRHVDHVLIGTGANTGFHDWSFITPPVPSTGNLEITVESPTVDRSYERGDDNYIEISSISIDPADENGEILVKSDILAGESGDVYEYTESFGDGFTQFNAGAIFDSAGPTGRDLITDWFYDGEDENVSTDKTSLADLESSYLASQLTLDRDRITGTADIFDFIALIDGYRVNFIQTDFRYGRSKVELIEIREHDIEATVEERKEKKGGGTVGTHAPFPPELFNYNQAQAIGELAEDVEDEERTSVLINIDTTIRKGYEYWVINENELSRENRLDGVYPVRPVATDGSGDRVDEDDPGFEAATKEYGPGAEVSVPIEASVINAPMGSIVIIAPGQREIEQNTAQERIAEGEEALETLNSVTLPNLQDEIDDLNDNLDTLNNVTLPGLQDDLDDLNDDLAVLNNTTLPNLQDDLDDLNDELNDVLPITETKISDGAISTPKLQTNAVTSGKILAGAITTNKIAAGAVVANSIASNAITSNKIQSDAITANKIGAGEIATYHLQADSITANLIDSDAVRANHIRAGEIDTFHLEAGAVTANKIDVDDLFSVSITVRDSITLGTGGLIKSGNFSAGSSGFRILAGGEAEFSEVTIRGSSSSIGDDAVFDDVTVNGTLMMNNGEIRNGGGDFTINEDGMGIVISSGSSFQRERAFTLETSGGSVKGYLWGTSVDDSIRLVSDDNLVVEAKDGRVLISSNGNDIEMNSGRYVIMPGMEASDPHVAGALYRDGNNLQISTG